MSEIFNVSTNPHVRSGNTTQTIMRDVLIALTPASIFGIVNFGLDALLRIVIGIVTCVACEALYQYFMHKKVTVTDLSAAVTGLLIALNIPSTLNVGFEIVGCVFAIIVVKQLFGGLGQNFMQNELKRLTRSERTHRLCTRAGMLETFLKEPTVLTDEDVMELLTFIFQSETVQKKLNLLIESRRETLTTDGSENPLF